MLVISVRGTPVPVGCWNLFLIQIPLQASNTSFTIYRDTRCSTTIEGLFGKRLS